MLWAKLSLPFIKENSWNQGKPFFTACYPISITGNNYKLGESVRLGGGGGGGRVVGSEW